MCRYICWWYTSKSITQICCKCCSIPYLLTFKMFFLGVMQIAWHLIFQKPKWCTFHLNINNTLFQQKILILWLVLTVIKHIQAQKNSYSVSPYLIFFVGINILIMFLKPATHISICWQDLFISAKQNNIL